MALDDWVPINDHASTGGQGSVRKVQHQEDGRIGALKRRHQNVSERTGGRYRFLTEVSGLRMMTGSGVPRLLEANEGEWENPKAELYLVMELIEGPTMTELVQKAPPSLDDAINCTNRILKVLGKWHELPLHHRDIKPDNVILRAGRWDDPVLVDLGLAWYPVDKQTDFETSRGIDLTNQFLRLPEFAPGGRHHDRRSDITLVAGLLFFMISGRAPRVLEDEQKLQPHERLPCPVRADILEDKRWPGLRRILHIAFQHGINHRIKYSEEFCRYLDQLNEGPSMEPDNLERELAELREITESAILRERTEAAPSMERASKDLCDELGRIWREAGLQWGGQNPVFKGGGATIEFYCLVSRHRQAEPHVFFHHKIELSDGRIKASWSIENKVPTLGYEGSVADGEGLRDALISAARDLAARVIGCLNDKLRPRPNLFEAL